VLASPVITKLVIDNFKAIEHLELDLRPFRVFVGPNDSGKSTILQALDLLGRSTTQPIIPSSPDNSPALFEDRFERYLPHGDVARTLKLEVRGTCADGDYTYQIHWGANPSPQCVFEALIIDGQIKFAFYTNDPSTLAQRAREDPEIDADLHSLPEIHADLRSFMVQFDPKKLVAPAALGSQLGSDGTGLASLVDDLLTASDRQPLLELETQLLRFSSFIGGVGTQPTLDKRGRELIFSLAGTKRPLSAKQASSGSSWSPPTSRFATEPAIAAT
jgi:energy-coupling factor transporter ATP-binding protein EcfA2